MPDKIAKRTLSSALAALGEGQFAMSEASVHISLVFEQSFDMPHAANFLPFKARVFLLLEKLLRIRSNSDNAGHIL